MWEKFKNLNIFLKIILILVLIPITILVLGAFVAGWPIFLVAGVALFLLITGYKKKKRIRLIIGAILACFVVYIFATADYSKENMARITNETRLKEEAKQKEKDKKELEKIKQEEKVKAEEQKKQEEAKKKIEEQKKQETDKKTKEEQQKKKDEEAKKAEEEKQKKDEVSKKAQVEKNKKNELVKKLETYEKLYLMIPASIKEVSESNNKIELQKTFATGRDVSSRCGQELGDLKGNYDTKSKEYEAIQNLQMAFYVVKDACKNGIKYLDKNEYKYYEKYENNCSEAGDWYSNFVAFKEKIK
ncbi:TPA: tripartite tricarboxylate transporter TctB family protein [Clostridioides difficile]